jgi:hypothetical protein
VRRNLVLFGAGASIEYGAASTAGLTADIEQEVLNDGYLMSVGGDVAYDTVKNALGSYLNEGGNFEQIYHCIHELSTLLPTPGAVDEYRPLLAPFVSGPLVGQRDALAPLAHKIIEVIYRQSSSWCTSPKVPLDPLREFIDGLIAEGPTRIYSTNYDDFVLQSRFDLYTGYPAADPSPKRFGATDFWNRADDNVLFHLHGSVHMGFAPGRGEFGELFWYDDREEAARNSAFHGSGRPRMDGTKFMPTAVITGLDKLSRLQQRPLSYFYSALSRDAMTADVVYVIGSGLADLHLNTWLKEARSGTPRTRLIFVDFFSGGLRKALWTVNAKMVRLFHSLDVHISDRMSGRQIAPGWTVTDDGTAAIYDAGFQSFLKAPGDLAKAKREIGL